MFDETVFLGGGSGFVSKNCDIFSVRRKRGVQAVQDIFDKTYVPKEHKHYKDCRLGVSPHVLKCTKYCGKTYMMGQCKFKIY